MKIMFFEKLTDRKAEKVYQYLLEQYYQKRRSGVDYSDFYIKSFFINCSKKVRAKATNKIVDFWEQEFSLGKIRLEWLSQYDILKNKLPFGVSCTVTNAEDDFMKKTVLRVWYIKSERERD